MQRKCKISGFYKTSASVVLQQCQCHIMFARRDSNVILKFSKFS